MGISLEKIDAALIQTGWMRSGSSLSEQDRARNAWLRGHIVAMARIVDEGGIELDWSSEMDLNDLLNALHQIMSPTHRIVENLSELLGLVDEIEAMEEDRSGVPVSPPSVPEMNVGEQTAWLSRLCDAFVRAESVFPWRIGESPSARRRNYLVGEPPPTPPLIDEGGTP